MGLLDTVAARGFAPESGALDKGYGSDCAVMHTASMESGIVPIIAPRITTDCARRLDW